MRTPERYAKQLDWLGKRYESENLAQGGENTVPHWMISAGELLLSQAAKIAELEAQLAAVKIPCQPVETDANGVLRFRSNKIVEHLLDFSTPKGCGMNELSMHDFSNEDRMQFAQLIGYSLSGYGDLSYVSDESYELAHRNALPIAGEAK